MMLYLSNAIWSPTLPLLASAFGAQKSSIFYTEEYFAELLGYKQVF